MKEKSTQARSGGDKDPSKSEADGEHSEARKGKAAGQLNEES